MSPGQWAWFGRQCCPGIQSAEYSGPGCPGAGPPHQQFHEQELSP